MRKWGGTQRRLQAVRGGCKLLDVTAEEEEERQAHLEGKALDSRQLQECQATHGVLEPKVPPRNEAASTPAAGVVASVWGQCGPRVQQGRPKWIMAAVGPENLSLGAPQVLPAGPDSQLAHLSVTLSHSSSEQTLHPGSMAP